MHRQVSMSCVAAVAAILGACASKEDVRTLRRAILPPQQVAIVERGERLFENVAIYEVFGDDLPEFKLFDDGGIWTARPTRSEIVRDFRMWLDDARMLSPDVRQARYLLTVEFKNLRGPDFVPFADK